MGSTDSKTSDRIVRTVAEALDRDPLRLPPLEGTINGDAVDYLFHRENHPPGAYTVFPYCDVWVVAHSSGAVDVFDSYRGTTAAAQLPDEMDEPSTDERMAVLQFGDERYTFYEDQLDELHRIVAESADSGEAWDEAIEYARERAA